MVGLALALGGLFTGCGSDSSSRRVSASEISNGSTLTYLAQPYGRSVTAASVRRTVEVLDARLRAVDSKGTVRAVGDRVTMTFPASAARRPDEQFVTRSAQLYFYDWEPNVIGPDGQPAGAGEPRATGGPNAASAEHGLPEYQAVLRAAKRPPIIRANDTMLSPGCTPRRASGCLYGSWYLVDTKHQKVLRGPEETKQSLYAENFTPPPASKLEAAHINPGTVIVRARPTEDQSGKIDNPRPNSWYVLNDDPALTGSDITNPKQSFNEEPGIEGRFPDIVFDFTAHGQRAFEQLTKEIAHRGQEAQLPGMSKEAALQHYVVVLDEQVIAALAIDYTQFPEGIDVSGGSEIAGAFTVQSARELASQMDAATLPVKLKLVDTAR